MFLYPSPPSLTISLSLFIRQHVPRFSLLLLISVLKYHSRPSESFLVARSFWTPLSTLRSNSCTVVLSVGKKSISFYSLFARLIICYLPPPSSHPTCANIYAVQPSDASRGPIMLAFVRSASSDCATRLTIALFAHPPQQTLLADDLPSLQTLRRPCHVLSSSHTLILLPYPAILPRNEVQE